MNPAMSEYRRLATEDPAELVRRLARAESEIARLRAQLAGQKLIVRHLRRRLRRHLPPVRSTV
jgi:ribosomal protein L29